jgi:hypothetical protein
MTAVGDRSLQWNRRAIVDAGPGGRLTTGTAAEASE